MKLMIFFLIVVCLHVSAAGYGQKGTVTISGKDLPLEKVFNVIKKQTDYVCFYGYDVLQNARPVSLNFRDADVQEVLKAALWGQGLDFSITGKTITIMKRVMAAVGPGPSRTIKAVGVVYNEAGQPLSGANVTIKATGKGTITNAKGGFELPAVPEESPLVISFIGYAPQVVKVNEGKEMVVYLNLAKNELDKVVVQAYGTTTQRLSTGNIATVTAEDIEKHPSMNPIAALQGQVPGLVVTQNSGYASAPIRVELRGRSTINPNLIAEPLYIIDGVPLTVLNLAGDNYNSGSQGLTQNGFSGPAGGQSPFFSINPTDIESITVLKDADATAIYGSRGADGVIIINTKKGKPGKTKLELNAYSGVSKVTNRFDLLNTQQYLAMRREAFKNDAIYGIAPDAGNAYDLLVWDTTRYTDWQKFLWGGTGKTVDVKVGFSGGDKLTTFRVSGDYHRETSILSYSGADQRAAVQFNLMHKSLNQRLNVSFTSFYSYTQSDLISLSNQVTLAPNAPAIFDAEGHLNFGGWDPISDQYPFGNILQPYTARTGFLNSKLSLQYEILKGLNFSTSLGYSTIHNSQIQIFPIASQSPVLSPLGSSNFGNNNIANSIVEPQLEYKRVISGGTLTVLAGGTLQSVSVDGNTIYGSGYVNDNLLKSIANAPTKDASDVAGQYKYAAVFGRINYSWKNKYILNLSARRDGSSRFGSGKQYGNFGSIGVAWIFTEEQWIKDHLTFLSFGKLRASYGLTGSDQIGDYKFLTRWSSAGIIPYQGSASYVPLQHANPNLEWQVNKKLEGAINFGLLKDRLNIDLVVYRNRIGNQLVQYPLPTITGFAQVTANLPATVQNAGWEANLRLKLIEKKDFALSFDLNAGSNRNKLVAYPNLAMSPYASRFTIGKPLNIVKVFHYLGVDPQTGLYTFLDKNKDGIINNSLNNTDDRFDRDLSVRLDGGFGTDIRYKNWSVNLFFTFRKREIKSSIYNGYPGSPVNQSIQVLNHWQNPGDYAKRFARYTTLGDATDQNYYNNSDGVYSDGSYLRLRNLSISYDLPVNWTKRAGMQSCQIYFRGENVFLITKYNGIDPEAQGLGTMPPSKIFTGGLQFNF